MQNVYVITGCEFPSLIRGLKLTGLEWKMIHYDKKIYILKKEKKIIQ